MGPLAVQQTERIDVIFCSVALRTPIKDDIAGPRIGPGEKAAIRPEVDVMVVYRLDR